MPETIQGRFGKTFNTPMRWCVLMLVSVWVSTGVNTRNVLAPLAPMMPITRVLTQSNSHLAQLSTPFVVLCTGYTLLQRAMLRGTRVVNATDEMPRSVPTSEGWPAPPSQRKHSKQLAH